jgi:hypothetical protein
MIVSTNHLHCYGLFRIGHFLKSILENWKIAKTEKQEDIQNIYYTESLDDEEIEMEIIKLDFEPIEKLTE